MKAQITYSKTIKCLPLDGLSTLEVECFRYTTTVRELKGGKLVEQKSISYGAHCSLWEGSAWRYYRTYAELKAFMGVV